jgi:hypothetical protein
MAGTNNIIYRKIHNLHYVLICDENGISDAFQIIKNLLALSNSVILTLIYAIPKYYPNPLFKRELSILGRRFSGNLITYTIKLDSGEVEYLQEFIEAVINSNTNFKIQFCIYGNDSFINNVCEVIGYLNAENYAIETRKI